jgi:hypothetical protein
MKNATGSVRRDMMQIERGSHPMLRSFVTIPRPMRPHPTTPIRSAMLSPVTLLARPSACRITSTT